MVRYGSGDFTNLGPGHANCVSPWDTNVPDHGGANDKYSRGAVGVTIVTVPICIGRGAVTLVGLGGCTLAGLGGCTLAGWRFSLLGLLVGWFLSR